MLSECQLNIAELCNIPMGKVKKLVPNYISMCLIMKTCNFT